MSDARYNDLIKLILQDIKTAEWAIRQFDMNNITAYHIQQAFEKLLKLILYSQGEPTQKTHNLYLLVSKVKQYGIQVPLHLEQFALTYTQWESSCRYDYFAAPTLQVLEVALNEVKLYYNKVVLGI